MLYCMVWLCDGLMNCGRNVVVNSSSLGLFRLIYRLSWNIVFVLCIGVSGGLVLLFIVEVGWQLLCYVLMLSQVRQVILRQCSILNSMGEECSSVFRFVVEVVSISSIVSRQLVMVGILLWNFSLMLCLRMCSIFGLGVLYSMKIVVRNYYQVCRVILGVYFRIFNQYRVCWFGVVYIVQYGCGGYRGRFRL